MMKNHPPLIPTFLDPQSDCFCPETTGGQFGTPGPLCMGRNLPGCRARKELEQLRRSDAASHRTSEEK